MYQKYFILFILTVYLLRQANGCGTIKITATTCELIFFIWLHKNIDQIWFVQLFKNTVY